MPDAARRRCRANPFSLAGWLIGGALILLTLSGAAITSALIDQSQATEARQQWEGLLAATPAPDAILVSNDRNEIVPLFYVQAVEQRALGMTGLFPGIAPDPRFSDIGATVETALAQGGEQPVYLIKAMPGLEIRFVLEPSMPPLVRVLGPAATPPSVTVGQTYGPLQLLGYDLTVNNASAEIVLHWQTNEPLHDKYIATTQLLTGGDRKITQDDHAPRRRLLSPVAVESGRTPCRAPHLPLAEPLPQSARLSRRLLPRQ